MAAIEISATQSAQSAQLFGAALSGERDRLVRLCARMSGDPRIAEDLAQETLFEAWRSQERLRDPAEIAPWLTAIARNVCLRWQRAQGRERLYAVAPTPDDDGEMTNPLERIVGCDGDLTLHLERDELAGLLGRALALLPTETREALVAAYLDELPQQELAARLGLREGALRARLHRGRQMLRRVLEDDLRRDALTWGLLTESEPQWQETRIWCPFCGIHHLACRFDRTTGAFAFRCAGVCQPGIEGVVGSGERTDALSTLISPKVLLSRQCLMLGVTYRNMMTGAREMCPACGLPARIAQWQPGDNMPAPISVYGILIDCPRCGLIDGATPWHLALDTAAAIQFWRRHPRIRALPIQALDFAGRPAVQTGFESSTEHARLAIITARDTLEVLHTAESG
jgi:RNA polymerase sigma factor (sigma-70 family)